MFAAGSARQNYPLCRATGILCQRVTQMTVLVVSREGQSQGHKSEDFGVTSIRHVVIDACPDDDESTVLSQSKRAAMLARDCAAAAAAAAAAAELPMSTTRELIHVPSSHMCVYVLINRCDSDCTVRRLSSSTLSWGGFHVAK